MSVLVRSSVTLGLATAGTALWVGALAAAPAASASPGIASPDCGTPPFCASTDGTPPKLAAAVAGPGVAPDGEGVKQFISIFVGNGTAEHPNAGLLIGNGYDASGDFTGAAGGNAGLLFGNGGNGAGCL